MKRINYKSSIILLIISVFIASLLIFSVGCAKKEEKKIKIGIVLPLTGAQSNHGEDAKLGLDMALEEINKDGGVKGNKIRLIYEDDTSTPTGAVSAVRKLLEVDKVSVIIGTISSAGTMAAVPLTEKANAILFSPAASSPKLSGAGQFFFRNSLLAEPQGQRMAEFCFRDLGIREITVLYMNDETGLGYYESFRDAFEKLGGKISNVDTYNKEDVDFRTQLAKCKSLKSQAVYVPGVPRTVGLIIKQAKEMGFKTMFLSNYGAEGSDLIDIAGDAAGDLFYTSLPISQDFIKRFERRYGKKPNIGSPLGYDSLKIIASGMALKGSGANELRDAFHLIKDFDGVTGKISFDQKGDAMKEVIIKTVKNGYFTLAK